MHSRCPRHEFSRNFWSERMVRESRLIVGARSLLQLGLGGLLLATGAGKTLDLPGFVGVCRPMD